MVPTDACVILMHHVQNLYRRVSDIELILSLMGMTVSVLLCISCTRLIMFYSLNGWILIFDTKYLTICCIYFHSKVK